MQVIECVMLTEVSNLPSSGQSDSAIIPSYLLASLVPCSFHLFIAWIYRETPVYEERGTSDEVNPVALWLPKIQKRLRN
jgi:hypothetical protein